MHAKNKHKTNAQIDAQNKHKVHAQNKHKTYGQIKHKTYAQNKHKTHAQKKHKTYAQNKHKTSAQIRHKTSSQNKRKIFAQSLFTKMFSVSWCLPLIATAIFQTAIITLGAKSQKVQARKSALISPPVYVTCI